MLIQLNQYPTDYEEEKLPQVIIEIRYRKGEKAEADLLAQKRMMILTAEDIVEITNRMNNEAVWNISCVKLSGTTKTSTSSKKNR
jgi:hypothetical protein